MAIVHNIIAPYRIPLFNILAACPEVDLTVLFMAEKERNRQWDSVKLREDIRFPFEVMPGAHLSWRDTTIHINPLLYRRLRGLKPDVIIVTSLSAATAVCLMYRSRAKVPVVVWWAGTSQTEGRVAVVKRFWRSILVPPVDAFLCYSRAASSYLGQLGVPETRQFVAGNVSFDAQAHHQMVCQAGEQADQWRRRLGLLGAHIVLSVGQLIPRKNHEGVLRAFAGICREDKEAALVIVGSGPRRERLKRLAGELSLPRVMFVGHVQPAELPMYYAAADLFLDLSLRDHWSQVVGEAMAAGLPVIVSTADHAHELIVDGWSGFVVEPSDIRGVARKAAGLFSSPAEAQRMGETAFETVRAQDVRHTSAVFLECLASVIDAPVRKTPPRGS